MVVVPCGVCGMYLIRSDDRYCGYCGTPICSLVISNDDHTVIGESASGQIDVPRDGIHEIRLFASNRGQTDLTLWFRKPSLPAALSLRSAAKLELWPYQEPQEIHVQVASSVLDAQVEKICHLPFESDAPGHRSGSICFCIPESGEIEVGDQEVDLGRVEVGDPHRKDLVIHARNTGGQALLASVQPTTASLKVSMNHTRTTWIRGYEEVRLVLTVQCEKGGDHKEKVLLRFEPQGEGKMQALPIQLAAHGVRGPLPDLVKKEIDFGEVVAGQVKLCPFRLFNGGDEPFSIKEAESDHSSVMLLGTLPVIVPPGQGAGATLELYISTAEFRDRRGVVSGLLTLTTDIQRMPQIFVPWRLNLLTPETNEDLILAIDYGTVNSCSAVFDCQATTPPEVVRDNADSSSDGTIPSMLVFLPERPRTFLFGSQAKERAHLYPEGVVDSQKRSLDEGVRHIYGREYDAIDLASLVIEQMILEAVRRYRNRPKAVAMTVPAAYQGYKRDAMLRACERAAKRVLNIDEKQIFVVDEPTAVAVHYVTSVLKQSGIDASHSMHLLVFDFGGGTLDISILKFETTEKGGKRVSPLIVRGDNCMGGIDIDLAVLRGMIPRATRVAPSMDERAVKLDRVEFEKDYGTRCGAFMGARYKWATVSCGAKESLSDKDTTDFYVEALYDRNGSVIKSEKGSVEFRTQFSREEFEHLISDRVDAAERIVKSVLSGSGLSPEQIQVVLMTGQSSRIPLFRKMMKSMFPKAHVPPERECPLKTSVACGGAYVAYTTLYGDPNIFRVDGLDQTSYRYGVSLPTGLGQKRFVQVIAARCPYPEAKGVYLHRVGREYGRMIEVVQNGTDKDTYDPIERNDISCIGTLDMSEFAPSRQGEFNEVTVGMWFSERGQLCVAANEKRLTLRPSKTGLEVYL